MAVFRVEKNHNYTVMSNFHLRDTNLSLKAVGLLSKMLSLTDEWNYTTRGLAAICKEGVDAIGAALKELESCGYLVRNQLRDAKGRICDTEYIIYESPHTPLPDTALPYTENPDMDKPDTEQPYTRKPSQLNKDIRITEKQIRIYLLLKNQILIDQILRGTSRKQVLRATRDMMGWDTIKHKKP